MGALFFKNWEVTRDYLGLDLGILAHDFVYNPREEGNEIRSIFAINRLGNFSREIEQGGGGWVLTTLPTAPTSIMGDMDLAILAAPRPIYQRYTRDMP